MPKYRVYYNKHKYQDHSDPAKRSSAVVRADNAEDAGYLLASTRSRTDTYGLRTKQGNRYYIGIIHYGETKKVGR